MRTHAASESLSPAAQRLAAGLEALRKELEAPPGPAGPAPGFDLRHAELVDAYFQDRFHEVLERGRPGFALVAVGGYGRAELSLHSDIDILIVVDRKLPAQALDLAQPLFLPLWDLGYQLGHGFRTIRDCVDLAESDFQVLASLLDMRLLAGSQAVFDKLSARIGDSVLKKRGKMFLEWLDERQKERHARFGDASGQLEPQLKEGQGGLRDWHAAHWLTRVWRKEPVRDLAEVLGLPAEERLRFQEGLALLCATRNQLHRLSGRKNDRLHLDLQHPIALALGFRDAEGVFAVEAFLGQLNRAMAEIKVFCRFFWDEYHGGGGAELPEPRAEDPSSLLELFLAAGRKGLPLGPEVRRQAAHRRESLRELTGSPGLLDFFTDCFRTGRAYDILVPMLETGLLGVLLPEFEAVRDRVQFDGYHTHPVGRHTLEAVRELEDLARKPEGLPGGIWKESGEPLPLFMAVLFHDLGKAEDIERHSERGAALLEEVLGSWGADKALIQEAAFLVERHLLLVEITQHRDLNDESVVVDAASIIQTVPRLNLLYLMTYADSRATGPRAWSDWTSQLLAEGYRKIRHLLEQRSLAEPQSARTILRTRDRVRTLAREHFSPERIETALEQMTPRYTLSQEPEAIVRHMRLMTEFQRLLDEEIPRLTGGRQPLGVTAMESNRRKGGFWDLTFIALDQPGLLSTFAGVLALHGVNILAADLHVWRNDRVLAMFTVMEPPDPLYAEETWSRIRSSVKYAITGKLSLEYRLAARRASPLAGAKPGGLGAQVRLDNDATDFYTLIEVQAWDRVGLLYDIVHTLHDLALTVHVAKIATPGQRVLDVFYIRDAYGQKVIDPQQIEEVRQALTHRLDQA